VPSTVQQVFGAAGLATPDHVKWCERVPESGPGVYVVALTDKTLEVARTRARCPLETTTLEHLLSIRAVEVDKEPATVETLAKRLKQYWLRDECVLYVGRASKSVRKRVRDYYRTPPGATRPHAGGWWLKTLKVLPGLHVHFARTNDHLQAEKAMLGEFAKRVSPESQAALHDPERPMPFANRKNEDDLPKRHLISGDTVPLEPVSLLVGT